MPRPNPLTPEVQRAFLDSIRGGALVVAAAASVGVPLGTLYRRRKCDPLFDLAWSAAAELSVEWRWDPVGRRKVRARGCRRRLRFSERRRTAYLDVLAQGCNAGRAARETGVDLRSVYRRLRSDPGFERDSREALKRGFAGLHRALEAERIAMEARIRSGALKWKIEPTGEVTGDFDRQMLLLKRFERPDGTIGSRRVRHGYMRSMRFEDAILLLDRKMRGLGLVPDRPLAERAKAAEP